MITDKFYKGGVFYNKGQYFKVRRNFGQNYQQVTKIQNLFLNFQKFYEQTLENFSNQLSESNYEVFF